MAKETRIEARLERERAERRAQGFIAEIERERADEEQVWDALLAGASDFSCG